MAKKYGRQQLAQTPKPVTNPDTGFTEIFADANNNGKLTALDSAGTSEALVTDSDLTNLEPAFTKNTAFNKNFGTDADTVCQGNDGRLSDARTPVSHTHGAITDAGAVGSTADLPLRTGASGAVQAGAWQSTTPSAATATGAAGTSNNFSRGDHAHPSRISLTAPATPVNGDIWII